MISSQSGSKRPHYENKIPLLLASLQVIWARCLNVNSMHVNREDAKIAKHSRNLKMTRIVFVPRVTPMVSLSCMSNRFLNMMIIKMLLWID